MPCLVPLNDLLAERSIVAQILWQQEQPGYKLVSETWKKIPVDRRNDCLILLVYQPGIPKLETRCHLLPYVINGSCLALRPFTRRITAITIMTSTKNPAPPPIPPMTLALIPLLLGVGLLACTDTIPVYGVI